MWLITMYVFGALFYLYLGYVGTKGSKDPNCVHPLEITAVCVACLTLCVIIFKAASVAHGILV